MKLPEVLKTREGGGRAESQAAQMRRRAEENLSPDLPLCQTAFTRDALQKGGPGGEATAGTAHTSKKVKWLPSELNFTSW